MRIAVVGAGALGSAVAAALTGAGRDVLVVARGERLRALQAGPLRIAGADGVHEVAVRAAGVDAPLPAIDIAILCVKTFQLETALAGIGPALAGEGIVMTLQNGVEAPDQVALAVPGITVAAGRAHGFFEMEGPVVRHVGVAPSILLGCVHGNRARVEQVLPEAFAGSGIPAAMAPDIRRSLWEKALLSAGLGSVAAALDVPAGSVLAHPDGPGLLHAALGEVAALACALGVALNAGDRQRAIDLIGGFPPGATTSLQRDLACGAPSEYAALTGAVQRLATEQGVPHPTFVQLVGMIAARYPAAPDPAA